MNTGDSLVADTERPDTAPLQAVAPRSRLLRLLSHVFSYPAALAAGLITITSLSAFTRLEDPDLWWHLKNGEVIWNTHQIPAVELFSFTAQGRPWVAHEWLSELSLFAAYRVGGYPGLVLWIAVLGSLIYLAVYLLCWRTSRNALVSLRGGVIAFCFGSVGLGPRPLLVGHLFLVAEILVLELARTRRARWLWLLPPMFAVWINCHGSYVFGLAVAAVYFVCCFFKSGFGWFVKEDYGPDFRRTLGFALAACTAAVFLNPLGPRLVFYPFDVLLFQKTNISSVEEWFPPSLREANTYVMLAVMGGVLLLAANRRLSLRQIAFVCLASVLALQHRRMLFLFGLLTAPVLSNYGWGSEGKRANPLANAFVICGCLAAMVWFFPNGKNLETQVESRSPVAAVRYIRQAHLAGPMLNEYRFGGYLIWALPENKVFVDGRADVFEWTGVLDDYVRWATLADDPKALLDKYGISFCVLYRGSPAARVIPYLPGWKKVYEDALAVIFVRESASAKRTGVS
jgi:hypothetical protein